VWIFDLKILISGVFETGERGARIVPVQRWGFDHFSFWDVNP